MLHSKWAIVDGWQRVWNSSVVDTSGWVGSSTSALSELDENEDDVYEHPSSRHKRDDPTPRRRQLGLPIEVDADRVPIQITLPDLFMRLLGLFQLSFTYSLFRHIFKNSNIFNIQIISIKIIKILLKEILIK